MIRYLAAVLLLEGCGASSKASSCINKGSSAVAADCP